MFVIFWGWNEEGQPMFESTISSQTPEIKEAQIYKTKDAAVAALGDTAIFAHVITIIEAKEIKPKT